MSYSPELQAEIAEFVRDMPEETLPQSLEKIRAGNAFAIGWLRGENKALREEIARLQKG